MLKLFAALLAAVLLIGGYSLASESPPSPDGDREIVAHHGCGWGNRGGRGGRGRSGDDRYYDGGGWCWR